MRADDMDSTFARDRGRTAAAGPGLALERIARFLDERTMGEWLAFAAGLIIGLMI